MAAPQVLTVVHLNIGQPDIETPPQYFEAVRNFQLPVLAYAESPGMPVLIKAIQKYYGSLGMHFEEGDILITTGGSEALQIVFNCILDDGDENFIIPPCFLPPLRGGPGSDLSIRFAPSGAGTGAFFSCERKEPKDHLGNCVS